MRGQKRCLLPVEESVGDIIELLVVFSAFFDELGVVYTFRFRNKIVHQVSLSLKYLSVNLELSVFTPFPLQSPPLFLGFSDVMAVPGTLLV